MHRLGHIWEELGEKDRAVEAYLTWRSLAQDLDDERIDLTDVLQNLQSLSPNTPVVVVSKYQQADIIVKAVKAGAVRIVGTEKSRIVSAATELLTSEKAYRKMLVRKNPYGDGHAAEKIMDVIARRLDDVERP